MTQDEQEAYVRSKWIEVYDCGAYVIIYGTDGRQLVNVSRQTTVEAWQAVYDFTVDREEEIRQVKREMAVQEAKTDLLRAQIDARRTVLSMFCGVRTLCAMCRTLARLYQKLTELKRGMKETLPRRQERNKT